ncbi:MAG: hypothetical protein JOZ48_24010, partial [Acidobacteriaceae bacterium]|nr:hypothetical protein [Acidobacteriaceae bacterium]
MSGIFSVLQKLAAPPVVTREAAVRMAEQLAATQHLISSLEYLASPRDRQRGGLNNWEVSKYNFPVRSPDARRFLDMAASPCGTVGVHCVRMIMAAYLMVPGSAPRRRLVADTVLAGTSMLMYPRHHYGTDGSDQMAFLIQSLTLLARLSDKQARIVDACLWTIALQATMSYALSGYVKLTSPTWRQGRALPGIMRTHTYG